ncbi:DUF420 domain-containing protein [bacterium]|nr:DUF420 domain-containing protein [bacterium]MBU1993914.1 DUF420 domain-containing protein [bacterium]
MFEVGFLGTSSPFYMDFITLYFGLLPFLMGAAIFMAVKKQYELHYKMQLAIFIVTLIVVVIFEIGVRISGGFSAFMQESSANYSWMVSFLIVHILVAIASVIMWTILIYTAVKQYKLQTQSFVKSHKKLGKIVYLGMSLTSAMGVLIYYFIFMYAK